MYLAFKEYVAQRKSQFQKERYELDIQYRSVLFHQFGDAYRWYCKEHALAHEYEQLAYDVARYEKRIRMYRNG